MVLGIAPGMREDDYSISDVKPSERGDWMDAALPEIKRVWNGEGDDEAKVGPRPQGDGPSLILGGSVDAAFERAAKHGDGWIMGGGTPDMFAEGAEKLDAAWSAEGRDGEPRKMSLAYFSLGDDAEANADAYLLDYYAWLGDEVSKGIAGSAAKDAETVQGYISAFESAGCEELIMFPCASDPAQVSLLAEAADLG